MPIPSYPHDPTPPIHGYTWTSDGVYLVCDICAAVVTNQLVHDVWHEQTK